MHSTKKNTTRVRLCWVGVWGLVLSLLVSAGVHANEAGTDNADYQAAAKHLKEGDFAAAWPLLEKAADAEPGSLAVLSAYAYCAEKKDDPGTARRIYRMMIAIGVGLGERSEAENARIAKARAYLAEHPIGELVTADTGTDEDVESAEGDTPVDPEAIKVDFDKRWLKDPHESITQNCLRGANNVLIDKRSVLPADAKGAKSVYALKVRGAKGRLGGRTLMLRDDNMDGEFSMEDTFTFSNGMAYAPLTQQIASRSGAYRIESFDDEPEITFLEIPTPAEVKIDFKGTKEDAHYRLETHFAFQSADTTFVTEGEGKTFRLPEGEYQLLYGLVYSKRMKLPLAAVVPGTMRPVAAVAQQTSEVDLGEDLELVFGVTRKKYKFTVGTSFRMRGRAGEEYASLQVTGLPVVQLVSGDREYPAGRFKFG